MSVKSQNRAQFTVRVSKKKMRAIDRMIDEYHVFGSYSHMFERLYIFWKKYHTLEGITRRKKDLNEKEVKPLPEIPLHTSVMDV